MKKPVTPREPVLLEPVLLFKCNGSFCPGLPNRASQAVPHPAGCLDRCDADSDRAMDRADLDAVRAPEADTPNRTSESWYALRDLLGLSHTATLTEALAAAKALRAQRDHARSQLDNETGRRKAAESELDEANAWFQAWPGKGNPAPIDEVLARKLEHVADQAELAGLRLGVQQSASGESDTALARIRKVLGSFDADWQEIADTLERRAGLRRRILSALQVDPLAPNDVAEMIAADTLRRANLWDRSLEQRGVASRQRAETMDLEAVRTAVRRVALDAFLAGEDARATELRTILGLLVNLR